MPAVLPRTAPASSGSPDDVLRSLRRYLAQMLGSPPWTVRIQRTRVSDDERPVAIIDQSGPLATPRSRAGTLSQGDQQKQVTYTVTLYPQTDPDIAVSAEIARTLEALLDAGFSRGLVTDDTPPKIIGAPWRLPIYDFAGIPISGAGRAGPAEPYQHASIDQFTVRPIQDPMDELRWTVALTLRVTWWQGGRIPPAGPIATGIPPAGSFG